MEVKRAKIGQHRPKMSPRGPKQTSEQARSRHGGGVLEAPGGLRISRIRRKKEKEEGGTRKLVLITPCHTVQAQRAAYPRLRQQPATALGDIKNLSKTIEKSSKNPPKIKSVLGPQEPPRPPQDPSKPENREQFQPPTGHHFGRILEPCWPQEPLKGFSKNIQNFH